MPEPTPQAPRVTPESAARLVAIYASRAGLTGRTAPAVDWTFTVEVVAGLSHPAPDGTAAPAWAVVLPQINPGDGPYPGGSAHVQVRDIDATPIPGFDGDPLFEIRVTLAHETLHCVVAEAVRGGALTVPAEEQIVEAAAQAIVRSEGTTDARVMARAVRALPSALRARIAASAGQRARGGRMDGKQVLAAIAGQDEAAALKILNEWAAEQLAAAGHPGAPEPDGGEAAKLAGGDGAVAPADGAPAVAKVEPVNDPKAGAPPTAGRPAARGGSTVADIETARARKAAQDIAADMQRMHANALPTAKAALISGARARLGADAISPATEKRILAATTYERAEEILAIVEETPVATRARSGVEHGSAEPNTGGVKHEDAAKLATEGFSEGWIKSYQAIKDPLAAAAELEGGRDGLRARRARTANGAAS